MPTRPEGELIDLALARDPVPIDDLVASTGGVLAIAPHPDDETLGCGLALRSALAAGRDVAVLLLTGGGASHPGSARYPCENLKALRRAEFVRALDALSHGMPDGSGRLVHAMLDLPDGSVPHDGDHDDLRAPLADARVAALELARSVNAGTVWVTWSGDPHSDHVAAALLADGILRRWGGGEQPLRLDYAVWGRFGAAGREVSPARVLAFRSDPHLPAKRAAMRAYASQLTPMIDDDPDGFVMPPALVEHFAAAPEIFLVREPGS